MYILQLLSNPVNFIYFVLALIVGITVHEFAHAWSAVKLGDPTPKLTHRLTLNPLAHLDLFGTLFLFLVGFGWGKPVVINPSYFKNEKKAILLTSFSGIAANLICAFIFSIPFRLNVYLNLGLENYWFYTLFAFIVELNLVLAAFNILPIPPLDGSKIFRLFLNAEQMEKLERIGPAILIGLLFLSFVIGFNFFGYIISYIVSWFLYLVRVFPAPPI